MQNSEQIRAFVVQTVQHYAASDPVFQLYNQAVAVNNYNNAVINQLVNRTLGWFQIDPTQPLDSVAKFWINYSVVELSYQVHPLKQYIDGNPHGWRTIEHEGNLRRQRLNNMVAAHAQAHPHMHANVPAGHTSQANNLYASHGQLPAATMGSAIGLAGTGVVSTQSNMQGLPAPAAAPTALPSPLQSMYETPVPKATPINPSLPAVKQVRQEVKMSKWVDFDNKPMPIGIDVKRPRPYDVFVTADGSLYEIAHKSRYRLPPGKVRAVVDYNHELPYIRVTEDGKVEEVVLNVNPDNEYLANELMPTWLNKRDEIRAKPNPLINDLLKSRQKQLERKHPTAAVIKNKEIKPMTKQDIDLEYFEIDSLRNASVVAQGNAALSGLSSKISSFLVTDAVFYRGDVANLSHLPQSPVQLQEWLTNRAKLQGDMALINTINRRLTNETNILLEEITAGFTIDSFVSDIGEALSYYETTVGPNSEYDYTYFKNKMTQAIEIALIEQMHEGTHTDQANTWFKCELHSDTRPNPPVHLCVFASQVKICYVDRDITQWIPNAKVGMTVKLESSEAQGVDNFIEAMRLPELAGDRVYVLFSDGRMARVGRYNDQSKHCILTEINY